MKNKIHLIFTLTLIMVMCGCARDNWRAQYSGNDCREVTPELIKILINPEQKINKDE